MDKRTINFLAGPPWRAGFILLALAAFCSGCGGGSTTVGASPVIAVSVVPASASVQSGTSQQFSATVLNDSTNKGVTWSLAGNGCAGASCGVIDATGRFTAPPTVPDPPTVTVKATSLADPTKAAAATVTIMPAPTGVTVSPAVATVPPGAVQQFSATVSPGGANQAVTWGVSGTGCSGESCGTIDASGKYTAPPTPPDPPTVSVTATSAVDPSKSGSASVTVGSNPNNSNARLSGQYAFLFNGFNNEGFMTIAGSFIADGNGHITGGNADVSITRGVWTNQGITDSTYSVGPDNRGSMTLNTAVNFPTDNFTFPFSLALGSFSDTGVASRGRLIASGKSSDVGTPVAGAGFFAMQDPAAFSTGAISGGYAFGLTGRAAGRFTASGGSFSAGQIDLNDGGSAGLNLPFTGAYAVDTSGRGTATLSISGKQDLSMFILYVVSAGELLWMDAGGGTTGLALKQSGGPFTASSLNGAGVLNLTGFEASGTVVAVGQEMFDGKGNLSGTRDENDAGVITSNVPFSGTYTEDSNGLGRGVMTISGDPSPRSFYLVSPGKGFIISTGTSAQAGTFEPQTGGAFSSASLSGNYVLGTLPSPLNVSSAFVSGVVAADSAGNLSGTLDNKGGGNTFTGTYSVAANGRATLSITAAAGPPSNLVFYLISPSKAVGVQVDAGTTNAVVNIIEK